MNESCSRCAQLKKERDEAIADGPHQFNEGYRLGRDQAREEKLIFLGQLGLIAKAYSED